jgi:hypothetical protein
VLGLELFCLRGPDSHANVPSCSLRTHPYTVFAVSTKRNSGGLITPSIFCSIL